MPEHLKRFTRPHPLYFRTAALDWLKEHAQGQGFGQAFRDLFERAHVSVETRGPTDIWSRPGHGTLLIGDHRNGFEFAPLLALFGTLGRSDVHFVATPLSVQSRILGAIAPETETTLPVIPRSVARDRKNMFNRDLHWRLLALNDLPSIEELSRINEHTLSECVRLVAAGHLVVWFPTGYIYDARTDAWQRGIGRVVKMLRKQGADDVSIVPFRFDDFPRLGLIRTLNRAAKGLSSAPLKIRLALAEAGRVGDIEPHKSDVAIVAQLKEEFRNAFSTD